MARKRAGAPAPAGPGDVVDAVRAPARFVSDAPAQILIDLDGAADVVARVASTGRVILTVSCTEYCLGMLASEPMVERLANGLNAVLKRMREPKP
jgi:hypothetical protein